MSEGSRRANIADAIARAGEALRAAETLTASGLHTDAVSRAYYAAYHFLAALLLSRGFDPRSHKGAITLFNTEFVRPGLLSSGHNRLLGGLQQARELADYDRVVRFSAEDAGAQIGEARTFGRDAVALLRRESWVDPESPKAK